MPLVVGAQSAATGAFSVDNCCRFNGVNAYLDLTFGTPTNNDKWSLSMWVKRCGDLDINQYMLVGASGGTNYTEIHFNPDNNFRYGDYQGSITGELITTRLFRDVGGWYHFLYVYDSANGTPGDRMKLYVNGTEETVFSTDTNPSSGQNSMINSAVSHTLGSNVAEGGTVYFNGYMAEVVFCDGQAYGPTDFGEFNEDSPTVWQPKDPSGLTFGDNGCYLDFEDSADLGADVSGNSNDWTLNNIDATDQATDSPTNNFSTFNPLYMPTANEPVISMANLKVVTQNAAGKYWGSASTFGMTAGLWYTEFEMTSMDNDGVVGIVTDPGFDAYDNRWIGEGASDWGLSSAGDFYNNNGNTGSYSDSYTTGDIIGMYLDLNANKLYIAKNGTIQNSGTGQSITAGLTYFFACSDFTTGSSTWTANFGNPVDALTSAVADSNGYGNFEYSPNDGGAASFDSSAKDFLSLCSKNLGSDGG